MVGAVTGTVLETCFLVFWSYELAVTGMVLIVVPFMLLIAFGRQNLRQFLLCIGTSWLSIVIVNGIATAVFNLTGIQNLYLYVAVVVVGTARLLVKAVITSVSQQKRYMQITLTDHGRSVSCTGLYDSGNLLQIPESAEPVHIADPGVLKRLLRDWDRTDIETKQIPFRTLGTSEGWIRVYRMERMQIEQGNQKWTVQSPWMGCADAGLMKGKSYQVILNSVIVDNMKIREKGQKSWKL